MQHLLISCEHGGNKIPDAYRSYFEGHVTLLASHRGLDIGALEVARALSTSLQKKLYFSTTTRLLVELNRSLHHPHLFSNITESLSVDQKKEILKEHYFPYRNKIIAEIENQINKGSVVTHLSIHSFTPTLEGKTRDAAIGLLYDPKSAGEKAFSKQLKIALKAHSSYKIRYNYPYKGTADGFTTILRKRFPKNYSGIEIEINQQLLKHRESKSKVIKCLTESLKNLT